MSLWVYHTVASFQTSIPVCVIHNDSLVFKCVLFIMTGIPVCVIHNDSLALRMIFQGFERKFDFLLCMLFYCSVTGWILEDMLAPLKTTNDFLSFSGTFCALDICLSQLQDVGTLNVFQTVCRMRMHRAFCIQTPEQYYFCYTAIIEHVQRQGLLIDSQ